MAVLTQELPAYAPLPDAGSMSLADALAVLRRRRWLIAAVFALLSVVAGVVAFSLPAVYRSSATILIKEQEIPQEFVRSTVTSFADERIQVISQQVLTRSTLLEMADKYGLYGAAGQRGTNEEVVERMRRDIKLAPVSAEVTDRRTGSPVRATIAFTLSYDNEVAANAQKIANELTTLFLNENVKNRQQKAAETTSFLDEELRRVEEHIGQLEKTLTDFKRRNQGRTPDLTPANIASAERVDLELQRTEREIAFLRDRQRLLEGQIADTRPNLPLTGSSGALLDNEDRLRALRNQLVSLTGQYSDSHPDVRRVRREIAALEAEVGPQVASADRDAMLLRLRAELAALRERYSDEHPDVVKLRRTYETLAESVRAARAAPAAGARKPDNPTWLSLQTQIATTQAQIDSLNAERKELRSRIDEFGRKLAQSGEVEREFLELVRDLDISRARFRDLRDKQMQAQVAEQLERSRKAERFTIVEPPVLPERPYRPNRQLIVALGLVLAAAGALGAAALAHALDGGVHGTRDIQRVLQVPVLAVWPQPAVRRSTRRKLLGLALGLLVLALLLAAGAATLHHFYLPLDVAWFSLLRRLGL